MSLLAVWIIVCLIIPLYSYNKILGIVIKKTNYKNEEFQHFPNVNKLSFEHFLELKSIEIDPIIIIIIIKYKKLTLMLWTPLLIMVIGSILMFVFGLVEIPTK